MPENQSNQCLLRSWEAEFDLYVGEVQIDGQEFEIPVHIGSGLPEVLLGRQWLTTRKLVVDMPAGILTLG